MTHFTFSILFAKYQREEMEIRHVPSCYDKNQLPSLTSTQLVFVDEVHDKQFSRTPTTSRVNDYYVLFPRNEEGKMDVGRGVYEMNNQQKKATFKYEQEGRLFIGVAKVENTGPAPSNCGNLGLCPRPWRGVVTDRTITAICRFRARCKGTRAWHRNGEG